MLLCRIDKMAEILVRAEDRVDLQIIARVVVVVALRLEDRVEIDGVDAEFLEIRQLRLDAPEIAAEEIIGDDFLRIWVLVVAWIVLPGGMIDRAALLDKLIAYPAETIGEDLVHDGVLEPVRGLRALVVDGDLKRRRHLIIERALAAELFLIVPIKLRARRGHDDEVIPEQAACFRHGNLGLVELLLRLHIGVRRERVELLALPLLPEAQQHLADVLARLEPQPQLQDAAGLDSSDGGTIIDILGIMLCLLSLNHGSLPLSEMNFFLRIMVQIMD